MVRLHPSSRGRSRGAGNSLSPNRLHKSSGAAGRAYFTRLLIWRTWFDSRLRPQGRCGVPVAHSVACSTIAPITFGAIAQQGEHPPRTRETPVQFWLAPPDSRQSPERMVVSTITIPGSLAHSGERLVCNQEAAGAEPAGSTKYSRVR